MTEKDDDKLRAMFKSAEGLKALTENANKVLTEKTRIDFYTNDTMQTYQIDKEMAEQLVSDAFDYINGNIENFDENTDVEHEIFKSIDNIYQQNQNHLENTEHYKQSIIQDDVVTLDDIERVSALLRKLHARTEELTRKGHLDVFEGVLIKESLGFPYEQFTSKAALPNTPKIKLDGFEIAIRPIISTTPEQKERAFKKLIIALGNDISKPEND
ncbi:MAG: hypothetical protein ACRBDI_10290 [Alphaproteobacteria bacterium]